MRFETQKVCKECREYGLNCKDGKRCEPVREKLRPYKGIRHTADGFDCALPVTIDSHSICSYACLYCFSDNITGHAFAGGASEKIGQTSLKTIEAIFADKGMQSESNWAIKKALRYDRRNVDGFPCAVQVGGLCDPCDSIEQNQGWLLGLMDLAIKYQQPLRLSTKGGVLGLPDYVEKLRQAPHLFWVAFSIITDDDEILAKVDRYACSATQRLALMKNLSALGVSTSLRLRPLILGISDRNGAYKSLIAKSAGAGAKAVSYETMFWPGAIPHSERWKWSLLEQISGHRLESMYRSFGPRQSCMRPPYTWTEDIMHSVLGETHKYGMVAGVSDPVWKQLSDVGCCCGILPTDKVFGNWEQENATNALVKARDGFRRGKIFLKDIVPPWSYKTKAAGIINTGVGPVVAGQMKHYMWSDVLKDLWNNPSRQRSPLNYFQGALKVSGKDDEGNLAYRYEGLGRQRIKSHWDTD